MLQSKQRLLELNSKLAETLTSKGITASAKETTTSLINKVSDISSGGGDDGVLASLIDRSIKSVVIPDSITSIGSNAFNRCTSLTSVTIPNSVTSIGNSAFISCIKLASVTIPNSVTSIGNSAFTSCIKLASVTISDGITSIGSNAFYNCSRLISVTIPSSITSLSNTTFSNCTAIKDVTLGDGFNANNLNLSASTLIERETMVNMFNALADRTGLSAYTLTLGSANLAKLTEQDILIATNKNWTLA